MFSDLLDYEKKRSAQQAVGFYIAYVLVGLLAIFLFGMLMELLFSIGYDNGKKIGYLFAVVIPLVLSFMILISKNALHFKYVLLALLSGILGLFGIFLGFILTAYLTTRMPNAKTDTLPETD